MKKTRTVQQKLHGVAGHLWVRSLESGDPKKQKHTGIDGLEIATSPALIHQISTARSRLKIYTELWLAMPPFKQKARVRKTLHEHVPLSTLFCKNEAHVLFLKHCAWTIQESHVGGSPDPQCTGKMQGS